MTSGALRTNPILVRGLALPFAVVPSVTLKNGVAMSLVLLASTLPSALAARLLGRRLPVWCRMPVYSLLSMACVIALLVPLGNYPSMVDGLGVYIPLAAVNTMTMTLAFEERRQPVPRVLYDAIMTCVGFTAVICGVSAVREILSARTLWGVEFGVYPIRVAGAALPFFGFILLGFLAALFRSLDHALVRLTLATEKSRTKEAAR